MNDLEKFIAKGPNKTAEEIKEELENDIKDAKNPESE
jgi:hypothetical protein